MNGFVISVESPIPPSSKVAQEPTSRGARLRFVMDQIKEVEEARSQRLEQARALWPERHIPNYFSAREVQRCPSGHPCWNHRFGFDLRP